ncbi:response regulator [Poseidonibacter ostreae]|jgi:DNA-binding response OmpR family regulator|uniref:Response regulator n=1 Tax=Poseidonibacter ostreae TaxID=2654171 RepID=A0A6L4WPC3_9BACT|nr:response regulator [Poseidonibacter ostreae]KAB7885875.1 response regulator [Poseidonibacter ostreae]KAB7888333.1 response regulator [Poseidonibacter ostreae]KAB7888440.1 response regulator [Poseidonibacter ostreae]
MDKVRILLIEDEKIVSLELKSILEKLGYEVIGIAQTAEEAYSIALNKPIDLVISDIKLKSGVDGIESCDVLQNTYNIPIIFMTAFNDDIKIQRASNLTNMVGYLVKPIRVVELDTMIKIAITKFKILEKRKIVEVNNYYKYDFDNKIIMNSISNEEVDLTKNESLLLSLLLNEKNKLVSYSKINSSIWSNGKGSDLTRRQLVHRLKTKLPYFDIFSVKGVGIGITQ